MSRIINGSVDLSKIDKSRIKTTEKGQKFYDVTIILNDEPNQWGQDVSICQGQTKEERERKDKRVFIGNAKTVYNSETKAQTEQSTKTEQKKEDDSVSFEDLPF